MSNKYVKKIEDDEVFTNPQVVNPYFNSPLKQDFFDHLTTARNALIAAQKCLGTEESFKYINESDRLDSSLSRCQLALCKKALINALREVNTCLVQNSNTDGNTYIQCKHCAEESGKTIEEVAYGVAMGIMFESIKDKLDIPDQIADMLFGLANPMVTDLLSDLMG